MIFRLQALPICLMSLLNSCLITISGEAICLTNSAIVRNTSIREKQRNITVSEGAIVVFKVLSDIKQESNIKWKGELKAQSFIGAVLHSEQVEQYIYIQDTEIYEMRQFTTEFQGGIIK
jgi:hypothetical protein